MTTIERSNTRELLTLPTEKDNIVLREYTPSDIDEITKLAFKNKDPLTNGKIQTSGIIDFAERSAERTHPEGSYGLGVWKDGKLVGSVNAGMDSPTEVEISYFTDHEHARQGIASVAVRAVVNWASSQGYDVLAHVTHDNFSSSKLLEKNGFTFYKTDFQQHDRVFRYPAKKDEPESDISSVKIV